MTDQLPTQNKNTLEALNAEFQAYLARVEEAAGEIDEALEASLAQAELALVEKADACAFVIDKLDAEAAFYAAQEQRLASYKKALCKAAERLLARVRVVLEERPDRRIDGEYAAFKLVKNPPSVVITDEAAIPAGYKVTETITKVEKKRVGEDLKAGIPVPGAMLLAGTRVAIAKPQRK